MRGGVLGASFDERLDLRSKRGVQTRELKVEAILQSGRLRPKVLVLLLEFGDARIWTSGSAGVDGG